MVAIPRGRWLVPAMTVMLVALATGPASGFFHGHGTGAPDDHCAVCHAHHASAIETQHAHVGLEAVAHTLTPLQAKAERDVCLGVHFCRGPPCPPRSSPDRSDTTNRPAG